MGIWAERGRFWQKEGELRVDWNSDKVGRGIDSEGARGDLYVSEDEAGQGIGR